MKNTDFKIVVDFDKTIKFLQDEIINLKKMPLGELKVFDLLKFNDKAIFHGVYIFFDENENILYVGKNSSQSFVERIPWHFAMSEYSWMNHFFKYSKEFNKFDSFEEIADKCINNKICLLIVNEHDKIGALEKLLRILFKPKYNSFKTKAMDLNSLLDNTLGSIIDKI
jgi:hypothetical protein